MTQAALVLAGIELMESGGRDEEVIGIMVLSNALAGDDEDDEDMALLLLAIAADEEDTTHLPDLSLRRAGLARGLCSHLFSPIFSPLGGRHPTRRWPPTSPPLLFPPACAIYFGLHPSPTR